MFPHQMIPAAAMVAYPMNYGADAFFEAQRQAQQVAELQQMAVVGALDLDQMLAMAGAEIYGAAPARASYPAWMHSVTGGGAEIYGAAAYGSGAEIYGNNPYAMYGAAAYGAPPSMQALSMLPAGHIMNRPAGVPVIPAGPAAPPFARGVDVQMKPGTNVRRFPLGFGPQVINAGTTATITTRPQCVYRAEKFVVPSDFAANFQINDIKVGKDSQFVASNPLPARAFTEVSVDNLLQFHGAWISQDISVIAQNNAGINQTFFAYMAGTAVE